ncbi:calcium-binding protein [Ascidiaceihabitans sp.]|uniref:calcium-binding protein n=1 Tax=Ascidiaceihabitans sp. TaxID=1872644 RepID=UPI003296CDC9
MYIINVSGVADGGMPTFETLDVVGTMIYGVMHAGVPAVTFGAAIHDADGNFYVAGNSGDHDMNDATKSAGGIYRVVTDSQTGSAHLVLVATSPRLSSNDGTSDPRAADPFSEIDLSATVLIRDLDMVVVPDAQDTYDDQIENGGGADQSDGGIGEDTIAGQSGNDTLVGGSGHDDLTGGSGIDLLIGGSGDDVLSGAQARDVVKGGTGDDTLNGGSDKDKLYGGTGHDVIHGDQGSDYINAGQGDDTVYAGEGRDKILSGAGSDEIWGGARTQTGSCSEVQTRPTALIRYMTTRMMVWKMIASICAVLMCYLMADRQQTGLPIT